MHTLGKFNPNRTFKGRTLARLTRFRDNLTFASFEMIAGRQPNDDEYFGSRTRGELIRRALKAKLG